MKKVIFGSACLISGMLLALVTQGGAGPAGPGRISLGAFAGYLGALVLVVGGLYLGYTGMKEQD